MSHTESKLTPAQIALLAHISPKEADSIYQDLHLTLELSIVDHFDYETEQKEPTIQATPKALNAWGGVLRLMLVIHDLSVEEAAAA